MKANQLAFSPTTDDLVDVAVWSIVEINIGILCACLPALKPLFNLLLHGHFLTSASSSDKSNELAHRDRDWAGRSWHGRSYRRDHRPESHHAEEGSVELRRPGKVRHSDRSAVKEYALRQGQPVAGRSEYWKVPSDGVSDGRAEESETGLEMEIENFKERK